MASERQEGGRSGCLLIKHSHCTVKNCPASPAAACGERIDHTLPLGEGPSFSSPLLPSLPRGLLFILHRVVMITAVRLRFYLLVSHEEQSVSPPVLPPLRRMMRSIAVQTEHLLNRRKQIPPGGSGICIGNLRLIGRKERKTNSDSHDLIPLDRLHHGYLRQACPDSSAACCQFWVTPVVLPAGCNSACKTDKYRETSSHLALGTR